MVHLAPHLFFYPALLKFHENTVKYGAPFWGIITTGKNVEKKDYSSRNQVYILVHALNFQRWVPDLQGDVQAGDYSGVEVSPWECLKQWWCLILNQGWVRCWGQCLGCMCVEVCTVLVPFLCTCKWRYWLARAAVCKADSLSARLYWLHYVSHLFLIDINTFWYI